MAQIDYFLKIDGVEGESKDAQHRGEIDVESWNVSASQAGTMAYGGGGGAGKVQFDSFHFVTKTSKASPILFLFCASGAHIGKAVLTSRKAGGKQVAYAKITLSDLLVASYQVETSGFSSDERVTLNFARFEYEYREQKADGTLGGSVKFGYDVKANKQL